MAMRSRKVSETVQKDQPANCAKVVKSAKIIRLLCGFWAGQDCFGFLVKVQSVASNTHTLLQGH